MPSSIEDYLQSLLRAAAVSPILNASNITLDKRTSRLGLIRGDLFFADGSKLYFRELVEVQDDVTCLMYSFHYQDSLDHLIFRYDDTPHHRELEGFPHHKHIADEAKVEGVNPPNLASVLSEIERIYPLNFG
jgi:Family of unknown function (DUF6516)